MKRTDKPVFCPEGNCECIYCIIDPSSPKLQSGHSGLCYGKMIQPRTFVYDGMEHANTHYQCIWTPLKGWVKFEVCKEDLLLDLRMICQVIKDIDPDWDINKIHTYLMTP